MYKQSLKERRKNLKLTLKDVAHEVGVSEATVSRWESGGIKDMKRDKINLLAKALNLDPMDLIFDMQDRNKEEISGKKVPLVGNVACGLPIWAEENIEDYISLPYNVDADFCLKCRGDSMINARIMDGDIVFIKKTEDISSGEIAVVLIENEATLKRVYKYRDCLVLHAENPCYRPIVIQGDKLDNVKIEGKAVSFLSSLV